MRRFCMARHKRSVNMVFLDGHAQGVALEDLWKLKWHNGWKTPTSSTLDSIRQNIRAGWNGH